MSTPRDIDSNHIAHLRVLAWVRCTHDGSLAPRATSVLSMYVTRVWHGSGSRGTDRWYNMARPKRTYMLLRRLRDIGAFAHVLAHVISRALANTRIHTGQ